jgi:hypothetical protein
MPRKFKRGLIDESECDIINSGGREAPWCWHLPKNMTTRCRISSRPEYCWIRLRPGKVWQHYLEILRCRQWYLIIQGSLSGAGVECVYILHVCTDIKLREQQILHGRKPLPPLSRFTVYCFIKL